MINQRAKKRLVPSNKNIILLLLVITIVTFSSFFYDESYFLAYSQEGSDGSSGGLEYQPQTEAVTSTYDGLLKVPLIISQAAIVGGVFNHIFFQRVLNRIDTKYRINIENNNLQSQKKFFIILVSCGIAILVTGTSLIYLQAFSLSIDLNTDATTTFTILTSTDVGTVWILRIITASIIIASSFLYYILEKMKIKKKRRIVPSSEEEHHDIQIEKKRRSSFSRILLYAIIIAGAICIFSNSLVSHNTALTFLPSLAISMDWLHFMAVAIWIGGLFYISAVLLNIIRTTAKAKTKFENYSSASIRSDKIESAYFLALLLPHFSVIATISLGIIGITGLYMAWIHLHTAEALFESSYGNILIIKLSAALPMVILGAYHQLKLHHSLVEVASMSINTGGRNKKSPLLNSVNNNNISLDIYAKFKKTIKIESIIGIGVLFAASFLTITSPPHSSTMMSHGQVAPFMTQTPLSEGSSDLNEIPISLDSFAILTIVLSAVVGMSSVFYLRKSRQQLKKTAEYLQY
ncbi:MAG: putative copper export protein [Nitrososphaeraceae archaeon]|nr:putative copper export protein [Nitrososphaeraceae archaeon]